MAKINIYFDNTNYNIDESSMSAATAALKSHLLTVMNGTGATINLGGVSYNVDSTKLSTATNAFVSHLGKIAGSGSKVVVGGVEFSVDSTKLGDAADELHEVLGSLQSGGGSELGEVVLEERDYSFFVDSTGGLLTSGIDSNFNNFNLTVGGTYKVIWDGAEYTCVANRENDVVYVGNLSISVQGANNTGEPFAIVVNEDGQNMIFTKDLSSTHTIGVYKVSSIDVVLEERKYNFYDAYNGLYATNCNIDSNFISFDLTVGDTYKVVFDNEEYIRVASDMSGYKYIGNLAIVGVGDNTGEPFIIGIDPSIGDPIVYAADTSLSHIVGIYKIVDGASDANLNEYGFYYNVPYIAEDNLAVVFYEDGICTWYYNDYTNEPIWFTGGGSIYTFEFDETTKTVIDQNNTNYVFSDNGESLVINSDTGSNGLVLTASGKEHGVYFGKIYNDITTGSKFVFYEDGSVIINDSETYNVTWEDNSYGHIGWLSSDVSVYISIDGNSMHAIYGK